MRMIHSPIALLAASALLALSGACSGSAGKNGASGTDGLDGTNGTNGTNGVDGAVGADGTDGSSGTDGTDGTNGTDGTDGVVGVDGRDGHRGEGPWGVNLSVVDIAGGTGPDGQFLVGDFPVVTFTVTDDDGLEYDLSELTGMYFNLSGPTSHYQIAIYYSDLSSVSTDAVYDYDGTWTYTFSEAIPATFHAPPNDTTDLGYDDGDWGGEAITDGTYTVAGWAYIRQYRQDGTSYYESDNIANDVLVGTATAYETREVVLAENCATCHGDEFYAHGGSRRDLGVCLTCHVAGGEDRYSSTDATVTPSTTIGLTTMIHKIHNGSTLTDGLEIAGYPSDSTAEGYPDYNLVDFSDVTFPRWPMEAATCDACHGDAVDGDVETRPTRQACGACHDTVDFATGDNHDGGVRTDDSLCFVCHTATAIEGYHADPRDSTSITSGMNVDVVGVTGGSGGGGNFQVGDFITVEFALTHDDGTAATISELSSSTAVFSGPTDHFQWILESASGNVVSASVYDSTAGTYSYTFASAIPATYSAQKNDTTDLGYDKGDWYGEALVDGTYRVGLMAYENVTDSDGTTWRDNTSDTVDFLFGSATTVEGRDVVAEDNCLACHGKLEFHGDSRAGLDYCLMCHTAGGEDKYSATDATTTPGVTIEFKVMIHKIHAGDLLTETYDINGYGTPYSTTNFNEISFPRQDGGVMACAACHEGSDAWKDPSTAPCTSCHDTEDAAAHAAIMTDETYGESCDVCHGEGADFAVEQMHDWLR